MATASEVITGLSPVKMPAPVFPFYLAARIKRALSTPDERETKQIIDTGSLAISTVGDCRYEVRCTDFNGEPYRIAVMLESHAKRLDDEHRRFLQCQDALRAIQKAAENLIKLDPDKALTARLIASLAREHVHG